MNKTDILLLQGEEGRWEHAGCLDWLRPANYGYSYMLPSRLLENAEPSLIGH